MYNIDLLRRQPQTIKYFNEMRETLEGVTLAIYLHGRRPTVRSFIDHTFVKDNLLDALQGFFAFRQFQTLSALSSSSFSPLDRHTQTLHRRTTCLTKPRHLVNRYDTFTNTRYQ